MHFASDNTGPAHPKVLQSMLSGDEGYAMPYGKSAPDQIAEHLMQEVFEAPEARVFFAATGTAANSLLLATLVQPYQTVFCSSIAHIHADECGAPEFFTDGARLTLVEAVEGKITAEALRAQVHATGGSIHQVQRGAVSLTQITEVGTAYTLDELTAICEVAKAYDLPVHMDGARFANAVAAAGCSPAEMTWKLGIDALSFGGTKNGCPCVEVMVVFDPARAWELELRRKRAGQLFSKHRYMSAQLSAYLEGDLWLDLARQSNAACARLARGLRQIPGVTLAQEPAGNMLFAEVPADMHGRLRKAGAEFYDWGPPVPEGAPVPVRMVCDWSASAEDTEAFLKIASGA